MNRLLAIALFVTAIGGFIIAQPSPLANEHVDGLDAEMQGLIDKAIPAFVFIGGGSGVVISEDGYFITNHHVWTNAVRPAEQVVRLGGNAMRFTADAVGADPRGDIVLGKIRLEEGVKVPYAKLGDSDAVRVGDMCFCIGNPFMLAGQGSEPTVTLGTVTATHRFQGGYNDALQIDTAINPGNSGGPAFNIRGEIIGINGRNIASHGMRFNTGAGYAIPSNQVKNFIPAFKAQAGGAYIVRHGNVGGLEIDLNHQGGARIARVQTDSEGAEAGFQAGDVIEQIDHYPIHNGLRYHGVIGTKPCGSQFEFKVRRGDETLTLTATNDIPVEAGQFNPIPRSEEEARGSRGMNPFTLPRPRGWMGFEGESDLARKFGGIRVARVVENSPASKAGLMVDDVVTHINDRPTRHFADIMDVMIAVEVEAEVRLKIQRAGVAHEISVTVGAR